MPDGPTTPTRAEARGAVSHRRPELADEGGDRGLAVGAGDGDGDLRLRAEEARGDEGKPAARIGILDHRSAVQRLCGALRHQDRRSTALQSFGDVTGAVGARSGQRGEEIAWLHGAAVGRQALSDVSQAAGSFASGPINSPRVITCISTRPATGRPRAGVPLIGGEHFRVKLGLVASEASAERRGSARCGPRSCPRWAPR